MLVSYRKKATHQQTLRPLAPLLCLLFSLSFNGAGGTAESPSPEPVKLIFDTDMDTDVDDIGAIAVVHAMAAADEIEILATVVSSKLPDSALCLNALSASKFPIQSAWRYNELSRIARVVARLLRTMSVLNTIFGLYRFASFRNPSLFERNWIIFGYWGPFGSP